MNELMRVYSRKNIILMIIIAVLNISLFYLSCDDNLAVTVSGERLEQYIASYPDFIEFTAEQSKLQLILEEENSFAAASVKKTAADYGRLSGIKLTAGDNRGIVILSDNFLSDILFAAYVFIALFTLSDARKKGLFPVIRCTPRGRSALFLKDVCVIVFAALSGAAMIYGGNFLTVIFRYGLPDLNMQLQSIPEFKLCPFNIKAGEYIFLMCLIKTGGITAAAVAFYALSNAAGAITSYALTALFIFVQTITSRIPPVSEYNFFKIFNLFSLVLSKKLFSEYCNINIFGKPVSAVWVSLSFGVLLMLAAVISGIVFTEIIYPDSLAGAESFFERIKKFFEKHSPCLSVFSWEVYKLTIRQHGGIIVILIFSAMLLRSFQYEYFYPINTYEFEWYTRYEGEITAKTSEDMTKEKIRLENFIARLNASIERLTSRESYDPNELGHLLAYLEEAEGQLNALLPILENVNDALDYTSRTGNSLMLIKPYAYDLLFRRDTKTTAGAALMILAGIIFSVSGVYSADGKDDIRGITRTTLNGRGVLGACRLVSAMLLCAALCVSVHIIQILRINDALGYDFLNAPIQSLKFMRGFGPYISILSYIILMMTVRTAAAFAAAGIVMLTGRIFADRSKTIGISAFIFALSVFAGQFTKLDPISIIYWLGVRIL